VSNSEDFILTIGIPTYNGAETIADSIRSCLKSIKHSGLKNVEILVVDNSSTDETFQIVSGFANSHPHVLRIIRNQVNIGLDLNIDVAIREAKGEYVKLLGDDDAIGQNFVATLTNAIKKNPFDVFLGSFLGFSNLESDYMQNGVHLREYKENLDIFLDSNGIVGQIAAITFNKKSYLMVDGHPAQGTNHKFLFIAFCLVARGISIYDSVPKIFVRPGSPRFTKLPIDSLKMQLNALRAHQALLVNGGSWTSGQRDFIRRSIISQQEYALSFMDYIHRYTELNSAQVLKRFYPFGKKLPSFYFRYSPLVLVPKFIGNFLAKGHSSIKFFPRNSK
jgi:glycosyltransferase involved in cell wall biosynthesis